MSMVLACILALVPYLGEFVDDGLRVKFSIAILILLGGLLAAPRRRALAVT